MTDEVGIRALKQNASAVVARTAAGETLTVTDRGRPVARLTPIPHSPLEELLATGDARPPRTRPIDLALPRPGVVLSSDVTLSSDVVAMRDDERY